MRKSILCSPVFALLSASLAFSPKLAGQTTAPAPKDPQAVSVLTQALTSAGGVSAVSAIQDFTATGNVTYYWANQQVAGAVTVKGRGMTQYRIDVQLNPGTRTAVVDNGAAWIKEADGSVRQLLSQHSENAGGVCFPYQQIAAALTNSSVSITDLGTIAEDGQQFRGIRLQDTVAASGDPLGVRTKLGQTDLLIDPNSFLVLRIRDSVPGRSLTGPRVSHEMIFSDYGQVNGVQFPFSVTQTIGHQPTDTIQFSQVNFNTGLSDSDFQQ
jgi:hypothetical protein